MKVIAKPQEEESAEHIEEGNRSDKGMPYAPSTPLFLVQDKLTLSLFTAEYLAQLNQALKQQSLESVLEWCCTSLPNLFQVTSFGSTGMVVIHALSKIGKNLPIVFLDTLYHFEETLEHARQVEKQYNLQTYWYRCKLASTRADFERKFDCNDMWVSNPHKYEQLTKVEPLERALHELKVSCWLSGRRRDQGGLREELEILEIDEVDGRLKVNPLAFWTKEEVWDYLRREGVPYNPLFDRSYTSIGDSVNTERNNDPNSGERAGRFYQFEEKTECGIHTRRRVQIPQTDQPLNTPPQMKSTQESVC